MTTSDQPTTITRQLVPENERMDNILRAID